MGIITNINVSLRGACDEAISNWPVRLLRYAHNDSRRAHNDKSPCRHCEAGEASRGNLATRNGENGAVLLSVLFFALFFAVLISKIFSTLQETKASSPRIAGAQIERYVSEAVMVNVINKCNTLRITSPHALGTPANVFAVGGIITSLVSCSPPDNTGGNCVVVHQVPVSLATFGGGGGNRLFIATATVTITDINQTALEYQWDCGQLTIDTNVQG